jgi:hypothetical protein
MPILKIKPNYNQNALSIRLGNKRQRNLSYANLKRISRLSEKLNELLKPRLYFHSVPIQDIGTNYIELEDGTKFHSVKLAKSLKGCTDAICFAATIGEDIDIEISILMKMNRLSEAFILDAMGSVAVESIVEKFWNNISIKNQNQGKAVSLRFSPGYCDWKISEQEKLFHFIDVTQLPITLNDYSLMSPRKSVSGIFGISDQDHATSVSEYNPCHECKRTDCIARRN